MFAPPNVKGWPGGDAWINSATLLSRKQFLERLFRAQEMRAPPAPLATDAPMRDRVARAMNDIYFDGERWMKQFGPGDPALTRVVLATEPALTSANSASASSTSASSAPDKSAPEKSAQGVQRLRELVLDPAYQLK